MRLSVAKVLLVVACAATGHAQTSQVDVELVHGDQRILVDAARLATLPRVSATVDDHGTPVQFEGPALHDLLALVGVEGGELLRGRALRKIVQVTGRDGYMVVLALAETDPDYGDRQVILADRRDRRPLPETEGPWRLIVGSDTRLGRAVRQVTRVEVKVVP